MVRDRPDGPTRRAASVHRCRSPVRVGDPRGLSSAVASANRVFGFAGNAAETVAGDSGLQHLRLSSGTVDVVNQPPGGAEDRF